jgi:hypothetical protein
MTLPALLARILSLLIAIVYGIFIINAMIALYPAPAQAALRSCEWCAVTLIPVCLIWFPEAIAGATGLLGNGTETPPGFISTLGWLFLIGIPLVVYIVSN